MVDQSHSSGDTVAKILEISGEWKSKTNPHKKKSHGVKSGDRGATALTRRLLVLYVVQNTK